MVFEMPPKIIPEQITLHNYREALQTESFDRYFFNSLFVATSTTAVPRRGASQSAVADEGPVSGFDTLIPPPSCLVARPAAIW